MATAKSGVDPRAKDANNAETQTAESSGKQRGGISAEASTAAATQQSDAYFSITVSSLGAVAGATAASLVYASANTGGGLVADATGLTIQVVGAIASSGATLVAGSNAGLVVSAASRAASVATRETLRTTSTAAAGVTAAVVGASTALAVTAGAYATRAGVRAANRLAKHAAASASQRISDYRDRQTGMGDADAWDGLEDLLEPAHEEFVYMEGGVGEDETDEVDSPYSSSSSSSPDSELSSSDSVNPSMFHSIMGDASMSDIARPSNFVLKIAPIPEETVPGAPWLLVPKPNS
jgi:hypothetical protein